MFFLSKTLERAWDTTLFPSPIGAVFTVFLTLFEITLSRRRRWQLFLQPHFIVCHKEEENICSNSDEYDLHLYSFIQWLEFPMYPECIGMCITKLSIPMFFLQIYIFPSLAETFPQMWNRLDDDGKCKSKLEKNGLHFKVWQLNLRIGLGFRIFLLECLSERSEDCCYSSKFVFLLNICR